VKPSNEYEPFIGIGFAERERGIPVSTLSLGIMVVGVSMAVDVHMLMGFP